MRTKEELKFELALKFYNEEVDDKISLVDLLSKLKNKDSELYNQINDFIITYDALSFTKTDTDLKLKAPDLWKQQMEMYSALIKDRVKTLEKLAEERNINIINVLTDMNLK